jgi:hypothetical protein
MVGIKRITTKSCHPERSRRTCIPLVAARRSNPDQWEGHATAVKGVQTPAPRAAGPSSRTSSAANLSGITQGAIMAHETFKVRAWMIDNSNHE